MNTFRKEIEPHVQYLNKIWKDSGITSSQYISEPHLDDTAVAYRVLNHFEYKKSTSAFERFNIGNEYVCHIGEADPGVSHLGNLISALETNRDAKSKEVLKIAVANFTSYFNKKYYDKWHISPIYPMSRVNMRFLPKRLITRLIKHLLSNQNTNGSWSYFDSKGTISETCYALITLIKISRSLKRKEIRESISKAFIYLNSVESTNYKDELLWIGKCLYQPKKVQEILFKSLLLYSINNE